MVHGILKPLCQGTSAAATGKRNFDKPKSAVHLLIVENSLTVATWLASRKPFHME